MAPSYTFSEDRRRLDPEAPLVTRAQLLLVCKEIDEETPEEETASFIMTAHTLLVNALDGYGVADGLMGQVALYLSAHFAVLSYPAVSREQLVSLGQSYVSKIGLGLENTRYGLTAVALDPTGALKDLSDGKARVQVRVWCLGNGHRDRRRW